MVKLLDSRGKLIRIYTEISDEIIIKRKDMNSGVYYLHIVYKDDKIKVIPVIAD